VKAGSSTTNSIVPAVSLVGAAWFFPTLPAAVASYLAAEVGLILNEPMGSLSLMARGNVPTRCGSSRKQPSPEETRRPLRSVWMDEVTGLGKQR